MFSIKPINSSPSTPFKFIKTHESNPQISTWVPLFPPKIQPLFISSSPTHFFHKPTKMILAKKMNSDAELASDLASEIEKLETQLAIKQESLKKLEEAMQKSVKILFKEICKHLEMQESEMMKKWKNMNDDDKMSFVTEFVWEWGGDFHPLSAKSVKEMVDMYLVADVSYDNSNVSSNDDDDDDDASSPMLFSSLLKFLGLF